MARGMLNPGSSPGSSAQITKEDDCYSQCVNRVCVCVCACGQYVNHSGWLLQFILFVVVVLDDASNII